MPIMRYFLFVGGVLLALLFVSDAYLPKAAVANSTGPGVDKSTVRITSIQKWPERIVFDTSLPTIVPALTVVAAVPVRPVVADAAARPAAVASIPVTARVSGAYAQLTLSDPRPESKPQRKRKVAKRHVHPQPIMIAQQRLPQFGFFAN